LKYIKGKKYCWKGNGIYMSEFEKRKVSAMFNNTIRILIFALLAFAFRHWWIALFSFLFLTTVIGE
jgi:hypothetical protein